MVDGATRLERSMAREKSINIELNDKRKVELQMAPSGSYERAPMQFTGFTPYSASLVITINYSNNRVILRKHCYTYLSICFLNKYHDTAETN